MKNLWILTLLIFLSALPSGAASIKIAQNEFRVDIDRLTKLNETANGILAVKPEYYAQMWQMQEIVLVTTMRTLMSDSSFTEKLPEFRRQVSEFLVTGGVVIEKYTWSNAMGQEELSEISGPLGHVNPLLILMIRSVTYQARRDLVRQVGGTHFSLGKISSFFADKSVATPEQMGLMKKMQRCALPTIREDLKPNEDQPQQTAAPVPQTESGQGQSQAASAVQSMESDLCHDPVMNEVIPIYRRFTLGAILFRALFGLQVRERQYSGWLAALDDGDQLKLVTVDHAEFNMLTPLFEVGDSAISSTVFLRQW